MERKTTISTFQLVNGRVDYFKGNPGRYNGIDDFCHFKIHNKNDSCCPLSLYTSDLKKMLLKLPKICNIAKGYQECLLKQKIASPSDVVDEPEGPMPIIYMHQCILYRQGNEIGRSFITASQDRISLWIQAHRPSFGNPTSLYECSGKIEFDVNEDFMALHKFGNVCVYTL